LAVAKWQIRQLSAEIARLRRKCGELVTIDELVNGFARPEEGFNIKRSPNFAWQEMLAAALKESGSTSQT